MVNIKMKVINKNSFFGKLVGLYSNKNNMPIYFETRSGIHTFLMKNPIRLLVLDENNIIRVDELIKPNRIKLWPYKYKKVIEVPSSYKINNKIKIGEKLDLQFIGN